MSKLSGSSPVEWGVAERSVDAGRWSGEPGEQRIVATGLLSGVGGEAEAAAIQKIKTEVAASLDPIAGLFGQDHADEAEQSRSCSGTCRRCGSSDRSRCSDARSDCWTRSAVRRPSGGPRTRQHPRRPRRGGRTRPEASRRRTRGTGRTGPKWRRHLRARTPREHGGE